MSRSARLGLWALGVLAVAGLGSLAWRAEACSGFGGNGQIVQRLHGEGPLKVGVGRQPFQLPPTAVPAGYGPPRREAKAAGQLLAARALVFESGSLKVALVSLDLLLVPERLAAEIRERALKLGVAGVLVAATHSHSSVGEFDDRLGPQVAALGRYRPEIERALVDAAESALAQAVANPRESSISVGQTEIPALVRSRDEGLPVDTRLTRVDFDDMAQIVLLSAHPTLEPRQPSGLSGDYPQRIEEYEEDKNLRRTMVLQSAVGNASAKVPPGAGDLVHRFAVALDQALHRPAGVPVRGGELSFVEVSAPLPRPESRRLVPAPVRLAGDALLCEAAPKRFTLTALEVGELTLLGVPGEPTAEVTRALEQASGARVVALANGYLGYLDTPADVRAGKGEAKRQYFGPELYDALIQAATATRQ